MENFGSWSVLTTNFLIVLFLALGGVTLSSILHLANGQWRFRVRYYACSLGILFPVAFVLLLVLLANGEQTFQWLATAHEGEHHLPGWHNYGFLVARQILGMLLVMALFGYFIKLQYEATINDSPIVKRRFRNVALLIPFAYVLYGTMVAWDFEMTMIPSWHSPSYGVYHFVSNFHAFLGFFALFLFFIRGSATKPVDNKILNYLAQMMLAFTILWTYFFFTQYLIMWYGRLPEEMERFHNMMQNDLGPLFWTFFTLKFLIPFTTFATYTPNRHNPAVIMMVSIGLVVGTWIERYVWVSGSVEPEYYHIPMTSFMDILYTVIVIGVSWFAVRWSLRHYGLVRGGSAGA